MWKALMPGVDHDHPVINVSGPNADDISDLHFPPTMVVVAGFDSLKDRQIRYLPVAQEIRETSVSGGVPKHDSCLLHLPGTP
ncbi:hypothetical protein ACS0TY_002638 [Phlomoides rotata]